MIINAVENTATFLPFSALNEETLDNDKKIISAFLISEIKVMVYLFNFFNKMKREKRKINITLTLLIINLNISIQNLLAKELFHILY